MTRIPLPLHSQSEWAMVGFAVIVTVALAIVDLTIGLPVLSRYWPLVGVALGVVMLAIHRVIAPSEWE